MLDANDRRLAESYIAERGEPLDSERSKKILEEMNEVDFTENDTNHKNREMQIRIYVTEKLNELGIGVGTNASERKLYRAYFTERDLHSFMSNNNLSSGPFSRGAGGGKRVIKKGTGMS